MKKYILGFIFAVVAPLSFAYAAMPMLTVSGTSDNNNVVVSVSGGEINAPVVLFYNQGLTGAGSVQTRTLGTTDQNGAYSTTISTSDLGISISSPVYVQVGGYQSAFVNWPTGSVATSTGAVTFSQTNPTFTIGQTGTITVSGGNGSYFISSNSNPNFTTASISGNTLTLNGAQSGQTNLTVCSTSGACAVITPTFSTTGTSGSVTGSTVGSPTISQSTLNVNAGGQGSVTISGGLSPYTVSVLSGNNISTTLSGNTLFVNGLSSGTAILNVCSSATSTTSGLACTPITVSVGTGQTTTPPSSSTLSFTLPITLGEAFRLSLNGGSGSYFLTSSGGATVATSLTGNALTLTGSALGSATINVCSTGTATVASACLPIAVTVTPSSSGTGGGFFFDTNLSMGMTGQDVAELQDRLRIEGYFNTATTGYFGPITEAAVRAYQAANGISAIGIVGPQTRASLNR